MNAKKDTSKPDYGNRSRPGSLAHGNSKADGLFTLTDQREAFKTSIKPARYQALRQAQKRRLWIDAALGLFKDDLENDYSEHFKEVKTEYNDSFTPEGYKQCDVADDANDELLEKYPLYSDPGQSLYFFNLPKIKTKIVSPDPNKAFLKCTYFSRPWYEELE